MNTARALPILMYHHVSPAPGLVTIAPATFRAQMAALAAAGWQGAGAADIERFFRGEPLPAKTCVITFDDGYLDNYLYAYPVLREFGLRALLFVVSGWLGDGPPRSGPVATPDHNECKRLIAAGSQDDVMVRWSEAEAMAASGAFEFHSHTHTHQRWDRLMVDTTARRQALADDLLRSQAALTARLGVTSRHLCWPQGYYDADYVEVALAAGYDHLYTTETRINRPGQGTRQIGRFVTKNKPGDWLLKRTRLYARPWLGGLYAWARR